MFRGLFGRKKNSPAAEVQQPAVSKEEDALENSTNAMAKIRSNMESIQAKIDMTQKKVDSDFEEAKRLRKENPKDPRINKLLSNIKTNRKQLENYSVFLLNQQDMLNTLDNAAFINEMVGIYEETKRALDMALADSLKKMQELIDIINERKEDVDEIMGMLTERPVEEDNQDLLDELDAEIAKEDKNPSMSVPLPSVPTSIPTAAPVARMPQYDEEAELNAQLENLWFVCCIRLCSAVYPLCFLFKRKYDRKGTECVPQTAIQGKSNSRIHNERRKIAQSNLTVTPQ